MRAALVVIVAAAVSLGVSIPLVLAAGDTAPAGMAVPHYAEDGALKLPVGYEDWVFVGASLGLSYNEDPPVRKDPNDPGLFHHIYMQPEAYRHYKETGKFPEKTMLVMENYSAGSKVSPNLHGWFEDNHVGLEVALKDSAQFEDGWAYFNFSTKDGLRETAKAFPKTICYDCHDQHAADDNVFVQFYPVLKREMVRQGRWKEAAAGETKPAEGDQKSYDEKN